MFFLKITSKNITFKIIYFKVPIFPTQYAHKN